MRRRGLWGNVFATPTTNNTDRSKYNLAFCADSNRAQDTYGGCSTIRFSNCSRLLLSHLVAQCDCSSTRLSHWAAQYHCSSAHPRDLYSLIGTPNRGAPRQNLGFGDDGAVCTLWSNKIHCSSEMRSMTARSLG
jgi:hypothetical protein